MEEKNVKQEIGDNFTFVYSVISPYYNKNHF